MLIENEILKEFTTINADKRDTIKKDIKLDKITPNKYNFETKKTDNINNRTEKRILNNVSFLIWPNPFKIERKKLKSDEKKAVNTTPIIIGYEIISFPSNSLFIFLKKMK